MGKKKKKSAIRNSKSKSKLSRDDFVLALAAPILPSPARYSLSSEKGSSPPPSPSPDRVIVEDWSAEDEDEELDFTESENEQNTRSKFFRGSTVHRDFKRDRNNDSCVQQAEEGYGEGSLHVGEVDLCTHGLQDVERPVRCTVASSSLLQCGVPDLEMELQHASGTPVTRKKSSKLTPKRLGSSCAVATNSLDSHIQLDTSGTAGTSRNRGLTNAATDGTLALRGSSSHTQFKAAGNVTSFQLEEELLMAGNPSLTTSRGEQGCVSQILQTDDNDLTGIPRESEMEPEVCAASRPQQQSSAPVGKSSRPGNSHAPNSGNWRDLFANNRSPELCPKLSHFSFITQTKTCILSESDSKCDLWKFCLVGFVAGKSPGYRALNGIIKNVWKCDASLTIHESGWLVYKFCSEEDKIAVLNGGPYLIYGRPLLLRTMTEYFDFSSKEMSTVPVWVKFPNLPLKCWSADCLSKIASILGKPIQCDRLTVSKERLSYARVLIEIDIMEELPRLIKIQLPNGAALAQMVVYETIPLHCKNCRVLGHTTSACKAGLAKDAGQKDTRDGKQGRVSVFQRLSPQVEQEAQICTQNNDPMMLEVSACSDGWELVTRKHRPRKQKGNVMIPDKNLCAGVTLDKGKRKIVEEASEEPVNDATPNSLDAEGVGQGRLGSPIAGAVNLGGQEKLKENRAIKTGSKISAVENRSIRNSSNNNSSARVLRSTSVRVSDSVIDMASDRDSDEMEDSESEIEIGLHDGDDGNMVQDSLQIRSEGLRGRHNGSEVINRNRSGGKKSGIRGRRSPSATDAQ